MPDESDASSRPPDDPPPSSPHDPTVTGGAASPPPDLRIPGYTIKRIIAVGGMGAVYEARQESPRRTVALKVMRPGLASRSALRRFEYESQVLARLRHPGIAQIFEAGYYNEAPGDAGRAPYFVMEYIPRARSIVAYCEEQKLDRDARLQLFHAVCEAVHHGHQKGVIHRDLKPDNILVDAAGRPKIIDFGVARATDADLAVTTQQTDVGQLIGTLQYMSPEQVDADPHDIDVRSDIYALGVVLYQLLTGELPYDLAKAAIFEATRVIRSETPTRLSRIDPALRGDLETIVLKALEKDRTRRYQTALDLAQDLTHYQNNEPISARPASMTYQLRMFARRHRTAATAALTIFAVSVFAAIISSSMWAQAAAARNDARDQAQLAEAAREAEQTQRERAEAEREAAELARREAERRTAMARDFVLLVQNVINAANPVDTAGGALDVPKLLDEIAAQLESTPSIRDDPEFELVLRRTLGTTYRDYGRIAPAREHLTRALTLSRETGGSMATIAAAMNSLAIMHRQTGEPDRAIELFEEAIDLYRLLGDGPDRDRQPYAMALTNLATAYASVSRFDDANAAFEESIRLHRELYGDDQPPLAIVLSRAGSTLQLQERFDEAAALLEEAMTVMRRAYPEGHAHVATATIAYATLLSDLDDDERAAALYREAAALYEATVGHDHPFTGTAYRNLGLSEADLSHFDAADQALARAEAIFAAHAPDQTQVYETRMHRAVLLDRQGRYDDAVTSYERLLTELASAPKTSPQLRGRVRSRLAFAQHRAGSADPDVIEQMLLEGYDTLRDAVAPEHRIHRIEAAGRLWRFYHDLGRDDDAARWRDLAGIDDENAP